MSPCPTPLLANKPAPFSLALPRNFSASLCLLTPRLRPATSQMPFSLTTRIPVDLGVDRRSPASPPCPHCHRRPIWSWRVSIHTVLLVYVGCCPASQPLGSSCALASSASSLSSQVLVIRLQMTTAMAHRGCGRTWGRCLASGSGCAKAHC